MDKYRVEIPDIEYYRREIPCQYACPVHTDGRGYVNAIADGDFEQGYIIARQPNPFASTCGRVCNAACETACRRGKIDTPVAIRPLKRFLTEQYGVEVLTHVPVARAEGRRVGVELLPGSSPGNSATVESAITLAKVASQRRVSRHAKVAVVGAGPTGLTAAQDLALLGYEVTLFERSDTLGGMLLWGLPEYRLPRTMLRQEIEQILHQGVEVRLNMHLGKDFMLKDLREWGYEAVFVSIGAHKSRALTIPGVEMDGVFRALDFLFNVNRGYRVEMGQRVLVVGGGGVAVDVARTAARVGEETYPQPGEGTLLTAVAAAREAARLGVRDVHLMCLESIEEMPAGEEEVRHAEEEGITLHTRRGPVQIRGIEGKAAFLDTLQVQSVFDSQGRFNPVLIPGTEQSMEADTIILSIGQSSDLSFITEEDGIAVTHRETIQVVPETLATTAPGVFAGGDVAFGPRFIIEAARDGHIAARSIDQYLQGDKGHVVRRARMTVIPVEKLPPTARLQVQRQRPPVLPVERRIGISEVELEYPKEMAVEQADRCLRCHIQTVFNGDLCILCGGCSDICPMNCFKLVGLDQLQGDAKLEALVQARFGAPLEDLAARVPVRGSAIIKDETQCIRCGLCARRCPTGAITMEAFNFEEEIVYTGSES
jgi:NADPH-dependent glutamate synthase beta subunit-like oxidoreductase